MARQREGTELHESERGHLRHMPRQHCGRLGPLQGEQRVLVHVLKRDRVGQVFAHVRDVVPLGRAVHHQIERIFQPRDHQIIQHAAIIVDQQRIALLTDLQGRKIDRQDRFERGIKAFARQHQLAHVGDIEQARILARPGVFCHDPFILDRHLIAGERHHPRALCPVPAIERQRIERQRLFGINRLVDLVAHWGSRSQK